MIKRLYMGYKKSSSWDDDFEIFKFAIVMTACATFVGFMTPYTLYYFTDMYVKGQLIISGILSAAAVVVYFFSKWCYYAQKLDQGLFDIKTGIISKPVKKDKEFYKKELRQESLEFAKNLKN
ncbi:hypothetical protein AVV36_gp139 [Pectobacterium bacteriophage PM2]|uniref:Uncharacterized protein n=1 Tax=Pectobacterium bacteriophage PM2 TaxID=1429794 RepID=A0A0A0Q0G1_9CAUD|nr:hypothetical protein AVV36_gp139 [Pectobacterium bacteriophage PM2]AHY25101.1 hypothetical protein PM2_139 [Pectobacterium bacteriophage PM2]